MWKIAKLLLIVLLPLAWGIGSDFVFASFRRNKKTDPGLEDLNE